MKSIISRKKRIRAKISGTPERPRVAIYRTNKNLYLQAIDDEKGKTIAASSTLKNKENLAVDLAKKLAAKKIKKIVFDRGGFQYHGKIKKVAEDLRSSGLEF